MATRSVDQQTMSRYALLAVIALSLASCGKSKFDSAKNRYEFLASHNATHQQLCAAGQEVANAAAVEQRSDDYSLWNMTALNECESASLEL